MRTCPYCGNPVDDNAAFCPNCGAAVSAPRAEAQAPGFCPNCGEKLSAGSAFCPNCGGAIQSAAAPTAAPALVPAPQKPASGGKLAPRIIGISAAAVAVIALAAVAIKFLPGLFSSPAKKFLSYQQDLFVSELLSGMERGLDRYGSGSFSTDLTVTASVDDSSIDYYLADSAVKLGIDLEKNSMVASGELVLMGTPVLSGTATYDNGQLGFLLPQADNTYYVMDLEEVAQNLLGVDLDLDDLGAPEISGKQWRSLIEAYLDIVYSTVNDDNVTVEKDKSVRLSGLGGSFTGTVYTFKPTADDIEDMLIRLADRLERDKDLRDLILQLSGAEALAQLTGYDPYGYDPYGYSFEDELDEALLDFADELRREAVWIGQDVEDSGFIWTLGVEGNNVRQIRISFQNGSNAVVYEADGTESNGRTELVYAISYGDRQNLVERSYTKKGDNYDGRISVTIPYESTITVTYKIDRSKTSVFGIPYGEYRVSIPEEDFSASMTVAANAKGGVDHTVMIRMNSYYYDFSRVTLNINATDRSSVSKPSQRAVDISDYSEQELEVLFYDLGYDLGQALANELIYNSVLSDFLYGW